MKRIILPGPYDVVLEDTPIPNLESGKFIARAIYTGISAGTERMWYNGSNPGIKSQRRNYPYTPGYEWVGEVIAVHDDLKSVRVGDLIFALAPHAEFISLGPNDFWTMLSPETDPEEAIFIALTMTSIHAVHRTCLFLGDTVCVVGLGVVGLLTAQVAKSGGAGFVVGITSDPWKKELAESLGINTLLRNSEDIKKIRKLTNNCNFDVTIECSGTQHGVDDALLFVRKGGKVGLLGLNTGYIKIPGETVFSKELNVFGIRSGGPPDLNYEHIRWSKRSNFQEASRLIRNKQVTGKNMITHRIKFNEIEKAYKMIDQRNEPYLQVILNWA